VLSEILLLISLLIFYHLIILVYIYIYIYISYLVCYCFLCIEFFATVSLNTTLISVIKLCATSENTFKEIIKKTVCMVLPC